MKTITRLDVTNDVALVTLGKVPSGPEAIDRIFSALTRAEINVDMISQTPLTGPYVSLSFTASGNDIGKIMEITARIRETYPTVKPLVSSNNVKLSLFGETMPAHHGVAAGVFHVLAGCGAEILLITTSLVDISVLVSDAAAEDCIAALKKAYEL